jgi:tripartite-type tricarboxylate transporter receptor subunit TctC
MHRRRWLMGAAAAAGSGFAGVAQGQAPAWPSRSLRVVVPFAPGGSGDITARLYGKYIEDALGQPVVIENRPGANGIIGTEAVRNAPADGYTLHLSTTSTHAANVSLYKKLPYDPVKDFITVGVFGTGGSFLVVHPDAPYKTFPELIAYAKANPGKLNYAHYNASTHVPAELLKRAAGIDMVGVPYRQIGNALTDFYGGTIQVLFPDSTAAAGPLSGGKMRPIAMTRADRWKIYPDLPTINEFYPGYELSGFLGMSMVAGTAPEICQRLNQLINQASFHPPIQRRLEDEFGFTPQRMNLEEVAAHVRNARDRWAEYVRIAGIEPQ